MKEKITSTNIRWSFYCENSQIQLWVHYFWGKQTLIFIRLKDTTAILGIVIKRKFQLTLPEN
jgi:aspartyl/asparaginyl-tRNA synthetase